MDSIIFGYSMLYFKTKITQLCSCPLIAPFVSCLGMKERTNAWFNIKALTKRETYDVKEIREDSMQTFHGVQ